MSTSTTVRVAAVQLSATQDPDENLATCLRMIGQAADDGAQIVVLPEFCNHVSWYDGREHAFRMAQELDGPFVQGIAALARERAVWVMVNVTLRQPDGRVTGTNVLIDNQGAVVATSDKQVLMGSERDHLDGAMTPGPVVETPFGRVGMYSCMDGVINETPRGLALRGAQVLLNSLNSFALDEASLHIPVRAPENRVWVIAANKVGPLVPADRLGAVSQAVGVPEDRLHGAGESQVVAPDGTVVARGPLTGEAVVIADIEVERANDKRRPDGTDVFKARRPDAYGPLLDAPHGRVHPAGDPQVTVAVVQPAADGADAIPEAADRVRDAVSRGAQLIVLPELFCFEGGRVVASDDAEGRTAAAIAALRNSLHGSASHVVVSLPDDGAHVGMVIGAAGIVHRQTQLHRSARHASWVARLGDAATGIAVLELPWGRLAVVIGDDAIYPETFRLATLADAEVVAVPFSVQEPWELRTGLVERAGENRLNIVAASRPTPYGAGAVINLPKDFTLWAAWDKAFDGVISHPDVDLVAAEATTHLGEVSPAQAANRFVSKGTDLVDGRPWQLMDAFVKPVDPGEGTATR